MGKGNQMPAIVNGQPFKLKYLFKVDYADGTQFFQTPEDKSTRNETESAFSDVLTSGKVIRKFSLLSTGLTGGEVVASVDLKTGLFEIRGQQFSFPYLPPAPVLRQVIYDRKHEVDSIVTYQLKTGKPLSFKPGEHRCWYLLGYQFNVGGKNYQAGPIAIA
jgi:hypothetical protein